MDADKMPDTPAPPLRPEGYPRVRHVLSVLLMAVLGGSLLGVLLYGWIAYTAGWNPSLLEGTAILPDTTEAAGRYQMRLLLGLNHACMFLLPGLFTLYVFYNRPPIHPASYLKADRLPAVRQWAWGLLLMTVSIPLVLFSYQVNKLLPLSDFMRQMESDTTETLKQLLVMDTRWEMLANLLVVALLPGLGEELIFRGIVQQQLQRRLKVPWMGIGATAVIFSAIHLQFEGFLPRLLLGFLLGWLYWRTQNFWVPALAHFFNNALQVVGQYLYGHQISTLDLEKDIEVPWPLVVASVLLTWALMRRFSPLKQ